MASSAGYETRKILRSNFLQLLPVSHDLPLLRFKAVLSSDFNQLDVAFRVFNIGRLSPGLRDDRYGRCMAVLSLCRGAGDRIVESDLSLADVPGSRCQTRN